MSNFRWLLVMMIAVAAAPGSLLAQQAATVTGRVTDAAGRGVPAVAVRIPTLNVATVTNAEGQYSLTVPAARITAGRQVAISAQRVGFASQTRTITLTPGASLTQSFTLAADVLQLEEIVATGQGTTTTRERLTTAVNTVRAQEITQSRETNVVAALAGKAPNVQVTSSAGDPGAGAYIQIRGAASVVGGTQPLFVVDGSPIDNSSVQIQANTTGTVVTNRAGDINPNDIADIQILKGGAATALYGSRGANGVVLITTKSGTTGRSRASFQTSYSFDNVNKTVPLQTRFGQGLNCAPLSEPDDPCTVNDVFPSVVTWGAPLGSDVETFDHANEVFKTGNRLENNLTLSGGSDRTTYYLSLGRVGHEGTIVGPQSYDRTTARLKGTHLFADNFTVGGNIAYTAGKGDFVQQGSNISGIQLGALRTPPEFNNRPYLDPATGLHRSYRVPNPTTLATGRGYDNPFWVANEITNTANVNRSFGNITLDYQPLSWLTANYVLGADYSADERRTVFPKSSSDFPLGRLIRADLVNFQIESRLSATGTANLNENVVGSLTLGQNLNHEEFRRYQVNGANLIFGTEQLDFAVDKDPDEFSSTSRIDGYFTNLETTLYDQLTLTGNLLLEGSSTFGGEGKRFLYPGIGASWQFSRLPAFDNLTWLDLGKIRANYGVSGRQPPVFASSDGFVTTNFTDGWLSPNGLQSVYAGKDGVVTQGRLANPDIGPERKKEFEAGFDLGFLGGRAGLGVTYYDRVTEDMILNLPLAPSTGYTSQFRNAARVDNDGIELTMDVVPVRRSNFDWTLNAQYARNRSCVKNLSGTETVFLAGFTGSTVSLVGPDVAGPGCQPFGVFYGDDFVRFGRASSVGGQNIDALFPDASAGAIYIGADGMPLFDTKERVIGDPNPDWTGSLRSTFTLFNNLRVSGLIDVSRGGDIWNGTRGALVYFGTHESTLPFHGEGSNLVFGETLLGNEKVAGPGAGQATPLNWATWTIGGIGSGFTGPASQFIEDASWVKLRDISASYTFEQPFVSRLGFSAIDVTVSGRNLRTWTAYTGIDPESNLTGQSVGRGLDYFNNPQTRSFIFSVNLNR